MKKSLGMIIGLALAMKAASDKTTLLTKSVNDYEDEAYKNTYTEFTPNPENRAYKSKFLGSRSKKFKK